MPRGRTAAVVQIPAVGVNTEKRLVHERFSFPLVRSDLLLLSLHIWSERDAPRYVTPTLELGRVFKYQLRIFLEKQQN